VTDHGRVRAGAIVAAIIVASLAFERPAHASPGGEETVASPDGSERVETKKQRTWPPPMIPDESPLYGLPYRHGLTVEVGVGVALCQPTLIYAGSCSARGGGGQTPGLGLRLGAGWRFNPHWLLTGAWVRQGHRPGGGFSGGFADGGMLAVRAIVPLAGRNGADIRIDLGFELGLGWSQRVLTRDAAPNQLRSSGALIRPALVLDGWMLADLALGIELAPQFNLHWQHCVDEVCELAPGPWVTAEVDRRWINGFTIAVRATGVIGF
jgi:hypothetical protein